MVSTCERESPRNRTGHLKILWGVYLNKGFQVRTHRISSVLAGATRSDSIAFPRILTPINRRVTGQTSEITSKVLDPWQTWGEQGLRASGKTSWWAGFSCKVSSLLGGLPSISNLLLNNQLYCHCLVTPPDLFKHTSWALLSPLPKHTLRAPSPKSQPIILCAEGC